MWARTRKSLELPTKEQALPGRAASMPVPERHFVNGHPIVPPFPAGLETAYFAMGCFWGAERCFWQLPGVYSTAVGYAGGPTPNPTYEEVCSRPHRPYRGGARRLRSQGRELRQAAADLLGKP